MYPLRFDNLFHVVNAMEDEGSYALAAYFYLYLSHHFGNDIWLYTRAANAFYQAGRYDTAVSYISLVNRLRPSVASYLIAGRCWLALGEIRIALDQYKQAKEILDYGQSILQYVPVV